MIEYADPRLWGRETERQVDLDVCDCEMLNQKCGRNGKEGGECGEGRGEGICKSSQGKDRRIIAGNRPGRDLIVMNDYE